MTATVTLELPEDVLVQALKRLPLTKRRQLLRQVEAEAQALPVVRVVSAAELDKWIGLVSVGGDALEDSERVYGE